MDAKKLIVGGVAVAGVAAAGIVAAPYVVAAGSAIVAKVAAVGLGKTIIGGVAAAASAGAKFLKDNGKKLAEDFTRGVQAHPVAATGIVVGAGLAAKKIYDIGYKTAETETTQIVSEASKAWAEKVSDVRDKVMENSKKLTSVIA